MRKLLLALLLAMLAMFLVACDDVEEEQPYVAEIEVPEQDIPDEAGIAEESGGGRPMEMSTVGLGEAARNMTRADILASMSGVAPFGQIILGSSTSATANILHGWDDNIINARVRKLVGSHFLSTMASNMDREFFPNPMVTRGIDITDNTDGSRTYTFTVHTDNRFSDGTFINASHYAGAIALFAHEYWAGIANVTPCGMEIVGRNEWMAGEADTLAGVRLYDDETFSVTIGSQWLPNIWEAITFMSWGPYPLHVMAPGAVVADDGDGVFLDGLTYAALAEAIIGVSHDGFRFSHPVGAGPYRFVEFNPVSTEITLEINPYFLGTWDGYIPRIQKIIFAQRDERALVGALARGEIDMVCCQGVGDIIDDAFAQLVGVTHRHIDYPRYGLDLIRFHVDHGPTQFVAVRQAINWMIDRSELVQELAGGHGAVVQGPYSLGMWWYPYALQRGLYNRITHYSFDPQRAIEILEEEGWVLNSAGEPFELGVDDVRYKDVSGYADLVWFGEGTDPSVNEDGLMRLEIKWAVLEGSRVADNISAVVATELAAIGVRLAQSGREGEFSLLSRAGGGQPEFHMFNLSMYFGSDYSPWTQLNTDAAFLESGLNTSFSRDSDLFELADRLRILDFDTEDSKMEFVDAWIDLMVELNYQVHEIPLFADVFYGFVPYRLQNWDKNSIWNFSEAIVRAYVSE